MQYYQNIPQYQGQMPFWQQQFQQSIFDRTQPLQSVQQSTQQPIQFLNARVVDNFDSITANDVPMNGGALFLKNDGSIIEYRSWKADGTISKIQYLIQASGAKEQTIKSADGEEMTFGMFSEMLEGISQKVDLLSDRLDEFTKSKVGTRVRKEASAGE